MITIRKIDISDKDLTREQIIDYRIFQSKLISEAKENSKHDNCMLCGKKVEGFCNSHSVPQMCLKNIASTGKLNSIYSFLDSDIFEKEKGINNAGTFHNICRECDGTEFQKYESSISYSSDCHTDIELINQIALKNILRDIYKHELEIELLKLMPGAIKEKSKNHWANIFVSLTNQPQIKARKVDVKECYEALDKCKKSISTKAPWLEVVLCERLDYIVPIAYQGMIAITTGFDKEIINDKFSYVQGYNLEYIHIAVLPFDNFSMVMLFIDKDNKRYEKFKSKIRGLTKTKRIQLVSYMLFLYCEDYFITKGLSPKTIERIKKISTSCEDIFSTNKDVTLKEALRDYDLNKAWNFANVLGIHCKK